MNRILLECRDSAEFLRFHTRRLGALEDGPLEIPWAPAKARVIDG